jgi:hypothetical protein
VMFEPICSPSSIPGWLNAVAVRTMWTKKNPLARGGARGFRLGADQVMTMSAEVQVGPDCVVRRYVAL